jgi:hypothetical protein
MIGSASIHDRRRAGERAIFMLRTACGLLALTAMSLMASDLALAQDAAPKHVETAAQKAEIRALRPKFAACRKLADQQKIGPADRGGFIKSCLAK